MHGLRAQEVQLGEMAPPCIACANKTLCHQGNSALQAHQLSLLAKSICEWKRPMGITNCVNLSAPSACSSMTPASLHDHPGHSSQHVLSTPVWRRRGLCNVSVCCLPSVPCPAPSTPGTAAEAQVRVRERKRFSCPDCQLCVPTPNPHPPPSHCCHF